MDTDVAVVGEKAYNEAKQFVENNWNNGLKDFKEGLGDFANDAEKFWDDAKDILCDVFCRRRRLLAGGGRRKLLFDLTDVCDIGCSVFFNNPAEQIACSIDTLLNKLMDMTVEWFNDALKHLFDIEGDFEGLVAYALSVS